MSAQVSDHIIECCYVLDDAPDARRAHSFKIEDAEIEPIVIDGPLGTLESTVELLVGNSVAVLCDYKLKVGQYAQFDGAELAAELYRKRVPNVLCTRYERAELDQIRPYRRYIPSLVTPKELTAPGALLSGFERCVDEFSGNFPLDRRLSRSPIKFTDPLIDGFAYFVVLNWNALEVVRLRVQGAEIPESVTDRITAGFRCHAHVNAGATRQEDLYFVNWEANK